MKKIIQIGAICCSLLMAQYGFADEGYAADYGQNIGRGAYAAADYGQNPVGGPVGGPVSGGDYSQGGQDGCCPADQPCADSSTGDCWCKYVHYEPCYYKDWRCIDVPQYYQKKCCRYCPKYYECQRCRYVPQYYTETYCRQEPEYYCTTECTTCKKWICDTKCKYVPRYYWKHVCGEQSCATPCPTGTCGR